MTLSTSSSSPLRTAVAGIGGFGYAHHTALRTLEEEGRVKVVATCDPALDRLGEMVEGAEMRQRGVALYKDFDAMLAEWGDRLDMVTVAAPIPLHAEMHRACVERGIPCYMEKPPTLNPDELELMIERDSHAQVATEVGFNYIYQPFRHELKQRLLSGEFGPLKRLCFHGLWPRPLKYYGRNNWAGRLMTGDGVITLDSCCGNAMAHHIHNVLFFGGTDGVFSWGRPLEVEAELYRANAIEGTDTIFCRAKLESGADFHIAASHACDVDAFSREIIECENATLEIIPSSSCWSITPKGGKTETFEVPRAQLLDNLRLYTDLIRGDRERPSTRLSDSRPFTRLNALFYLAAGQITTVPAPYNSEGTIPEGGPIRLIQDIEAVTRRTAETGEFPSEQGAPWAAAGGKAIESDLPRLRERLEALIAKE